MIAAVTEDRAFMDCPGCGAQVWHVRLETSDGFDWRPVEHAATCGRPCARGYAEGYGHKKLAMADLHLPGCGQCAALARDLELAVAPRPLLTGVPPGPRAPTPAKSWWPFEAKR